MLPLRASSIPARTPVLQCSAYRNSPFFYHQDLQQRRFPTNVPTADVTASSKRISSTSTSSRSSLTSSSVPSFSYRIGASFSAKHRRFIPKDDIFSFDPKKVIASETEIFTGRPNSGQDAFFVGSVGNSSNVAFGVADGVGGWSDSGIDSAHFSHGLCQWMAKIASDSEFSGRKCLWPQDLLKKAYKKIVGERKIDGGGSTACVATADAEGTLKVANLGDSGFINFRLNAVNHFSNSQTHAFNTPFQLSIVPPRILALNRLLGGKQLQDSPADSNVTTHEVRHGDVLIFATDGVWDNLSTGDLLRIVSRQMTGFQAWITTEDGTTVSDTIHDLTHEGGISKQGKPSLQTLLAVNVVGEAKAASVNIKRDGPFAKEVRKFYPRDNYHGGKIDDICVIVAIVIKNDEK